MKWLILLLFSCPLHAQDLWLRVGEVKRLAISAGSTIHAGSRSIVRLIDAPDSVKIVGLKPGRTEVIADGHVYRIWVQRSEQKAFLTDLRQELDRRMGLHLGVDDDGLIQVTGTLLRFEDWEALAHLAERRHGHYEFRARALKDVARQALTHFQSLARRRGFPILRFSADPEFTAHLPKAAEGLRGAVEESLSPYGIRVQTSTSELAVQPLVRTQVILAEVSRTVSQSFGVDWPSSYQAQLLPRVSGEQNLMVSLRALESKGQAQVLASPTLLCRSGSQASFHAGGEIPIRLLGRRTQSVEWKSHGVMLTVKPLADFQGAISLEIETEVSILDAAHAIDGIPALKTDAVNSHFDLPGKRTIALSGLLRQELGESGAGLPGLRDLPLLGPLFGSRDFQKHRSELVVFVTPEIYSPDSDEKIEMPKGWVQDDDGE